MIQRRDEFIWGVGIEGSAIPHLGISQFGWTGHDGRWARDLRTISNALGPCWLRYPIPWERVQRRPGVFEWTTVEERLSLAHELGFRLIPGLVHFGTPAWLPSAFGDPDFPQRFEEYSAAFADRFDALTSTYLPINEPLVTALFAGDLGFWPPFGRGWKGYMPVLSRIAQGLARATRAIREVNTRARILFVEAIEDHRSSDATLHDEIERRNLRRFLMLDLVSGRVDGQHPLHAWLTQHGFPEYDLGWLRENATVPTELGLDYYPHSEAEVWMGKQGIKQRIPHVRRGFARLAGEYYARYGLPLLVTETGAGGSDETKSAWLHEIVSQVALARGRGIPVRGLFWWPAFDHIDWDGALLHRSGNLHPVGLWRLLTNGEGAFHMAETPLVGSFAELIRQGALAVGAVRESPANEGVERVSAFRTLGARALSGPARRDPVADSSPTARSTPRPAGFPIVVHSHLRWSFVWQRPQQTHSRLAREHPVLFLEEPLWTEHGEPVRLQLSEPWINVTVAQPMLPFRLRDRSAEAEAATLSLLREALGGPLGRRFGGAVHWLYTPLMESQIAAFPDPSAVVYDCMDELSQFAFAPEGLIERERRLLERADLVFTGGYELFLSKRRLHHDVHFVGCGVDFEHFHQAANGIGVPADLAFIARPRLGYVGVIDERLDYDLLRELAAAHPEWSLAMIGPIVKVDPASIPRPRNVFYLGSRPYETLPSYLAGFDVCLMPFALNGATEFINPTKTLEYLATGKPVISTPIRDVVRNFGEVVHVAPRASFAECVSRVFEGERLNREAGLAVARSSSWQSVVSRMEQLVKDVLRGRGLSAALWNGDALQSAQGDTP
jgi:beta-glucosidase/6-phospho-beta-glucosidase/beta-galactosidase/glycosyltransferase involved in cell wall biosynthesis